MSADVVERLYAAFDRRDGAAMAAAVRAGRPFPRPRLRRPDRRRGGRDVADAHPHRARPEGRAGRARRRGSAHWIATYTFSATGRPVVNDVRATFRFADGLIVDHVDEFSFWKWSRQALGTKGLLLGWTPFLRRKVGGTAKAGLDKFIAKERARA